MRFYCHGNATGRELRGEKVKASSLVRKGNHVTVNKSIFTSFVCRYSNAIGRRPKKCLMTRNKPGSKNMGSIMSLSPIPFKTFKHCPRGVMWTRKPFPSVSEVWFWWSPTFYYNLTFYSWIKQPNNSISGPTWSNCPRTTNSTTSDWPNYPSTIFNAHDGHDHQVSSTTTPTHATNDVSATCTHDTSKSTSNSSTFPDANHYQW